MSILFETTEINGLVLKNRFVRSATWEGMAEDDGSVTGRLIETMVALAAGGVGLIISGHAYVERRGQAGRWQLGIYDDRLVDGLSQMVEAVHRSGGKIVAQLAHSGIWADPALTGTGPVAPSRVKGVTQHPIETLTPDAIAKVASAFSAAAGRAKDAGFDGVQLHSAHGYLLSQFLSPFFNRRTDRYGGDVKNRVRIHREVLRSVRHRVGTDYPVLIKINTGDFIDGGLELSDALAAGKQLAADGLDGIELSGGTGLSGKLSPIRTGIRKPSDEGYFQEAAAAFKNEMAIPVILVGGLRSFETAERIVDTGTADYISMSRPFIREPDLVNRWRSGSRSKATCLSDSRCFVPTRAGKGLYCVMDERDRKKANNNRGEKN